MKRQDSPKQQRDSVYSKSFAHKNPVPAACRIGNIVISGGIHGLDPETGLVPPTIEAQCALMFSHVRDVVTAAGGSTNDIIKMTVWMLDKTQRTVLNVEWEKMFPDLNSRPARHTMKGNLEGEMQVQCDFVAILGDGDDVVAQTGQSVGEVLPI